MGQVTPFSLISCMCMKQNIFLFVPTLCDIDIVLLCNYTPFMTKLGKAVFKTIPPTCQVLRTPFSGTGIDLNHQALVLIPGQCSRQISLQKVYDLFDQY